MDYQRLNNFNNNVIYQKVEYWSKYCFSCDRRISNYNDPRMRPNPIFFRFMLVIWPLKPKKMTEISYNTIRRLGSVADKKLSKNREGT